MENYKNNERGDHTVEGAINVARLTIYVALGVTAILALGEIGDSNDKTPDVVPAVEDNMCIAE